MKTYHGWLVLGIVLLILSLDQSLKFYIKLNFFYGEWHGILGDRLRLHFIENRGMAWGMEIPFFGDFGKPMLTLFRVVAAIAIALYIRALDMHKAHLGFIIALSLILAGAIGNIIDSMFYGIIFSASDPYTREIATLFPAGGGYSSFLHGNVVDMFYCPIIRFDWPAWAPLGLAGKEFEFFSPIFNIADSAITTGVFTIIIFQKKFFEDGSADLSKPVKDDVMGDIEPVILSDDTD